MNNFPAIFAKASVPIRDALSDPKALLTRKDGGAVVPLFGRFENDYLVQSVGTDGIGMESRAPIFEYVTSDYPEAIQGDMLAAPNGLNYKVRGVQPNKNFTLLILELRS